MRASILNIGCHGLGLRLALLVILEPNAKITYRYSGQTKRLSSPSPSLGHGRVIRKAVALILASLGPPNVHTHYVHRGYIPST
jgi:hypothetical protein